MKDTIVTARRKKTELVTLLICFVIANLANLYAIITYRSSFMELITSFFYVLIFAFVLYAFWSILRIVFYGIKAVLGVKKSRGEKMNLYK